MRAVDYLITWLVNEDKSDQMYIVEQIFKNLDSDDRRDLVFVQVERLAYRHREELKEKIQEM